MSKRRSWAKLNQSPARWVTYDENGAGEDVPTVPWWFALPMPEPWDEYLWHQWLSAWAEILIRVCRMAWRRQGARIYVTRRDALLKEDLQDWLWIKALEASKNFIPDPEHPNPAAQYGNFLRRHLDVVAREHFAEVIGRGDGTSGPAAREAHNSGIASTDFLDEVEAEGGYRTPRFPLHGHDLLEDDPIAVLIRFEDLEDAIGDLDAEDKRRGSYQTQSRACLVNLCDAPAEARGLCKSHYQAERHREQPNCSLDGCTKPERARGLCSTHYRRHREEQIAAGTWVPRGEHPCAEEGCDQPRRKGYVMCVDHKPVKLCEIPDCGTKARARGMCPMHYQRWRKERARGEA